MRSPRFVLVSVLCLIGSVGCSPLAVTLRVTDSQAARIGAVDRELLAAVDERAVQRAHDEIGSGRTELAHAEETQRAVDLELRSARDARIREVLEAKRQWAQARLLWREAELEAARRHEPELAAALELHKAEIVARNGVDLDLAPFRGQCARLHAAWAERSRTVVTTHAGMDAAERHVAEVKDRYAQQRLAAVGMR